MSATVTRASAQHCTPLASVASAGPVRRTVEGVALSASLQRMTTNDVIAFDGACGEELAAVLEGEIDIVAAGEQYVLSAGEAILIPPREARRYRCMTASAVLYRVACDAAAAGATESRS